MEKGWVGGGQEFKSIIIMMMALFVNGQVNQCSNAQRTILCTGVVQKAVGV